LRVSARRRERYPAALVWLAHLICDRRSAAGHRYSIVKDHAAARAGTARCGAVNVQPAMALDASKRHIQFAGIVFVVTMESAARRRVAAYLAVSGLDDRTRLDSIVECSPSENCGRPATGTIVFPVVSHHVRVGDPDTVTANPPPLSVYGEWSPTHLAVTSSSAVVTVKTTTEPMGHDRAATLAHPNYWRIVL
jgi:hypothetical protein